MGVQEAFAATVHAPSVELKIRWDDLTDTDESAYVLSADGIESMDDLAYPHPREATLVLDNVDGRYTSSNTSSPIYAWTQDLGQRATLRLGYDVATTGGWAKVGTYVVTDLTTSADDRTATLTLRDALDEYAEKTVRIAPTANLGLTAAATALLGAANLPTADYVVDSLAGTAQYAYANDGRLIDELWQVAIAEGGRVYLDEEGLLRVQSRANRRAALRAPVATLTASEVAYKSGVAKRSGRPNRVSLAFEDRATATVAETVFSISQAIKLDAGYTIQWAELKPEYQAHWDPVTGKIVPGLPPPANPADMYVYHSVFWPGRVDLVLRADDLTEYKSNIPVDWTSATFTVAANTAANGSGTAITVVALSDPSSAPSAAGTVVDYWWSSASSTYGDVEYPAQTLVLWNSRTTVTYVTQLDMAAKPSRREAGYEIVRTDVAATASNGGRVVDRKVVSSYLPDQSGSQERAKELLASLTASRVALDIPDIDGCPFLRPGDAFTYVDDTVTPSQEYSLQVLENRWTYKPETGYTASLVTMPALDTSERAASWANVAPTFTPTTTARTGPFKWGADANPLYWSQATWG